MIDLAKVERLMGLMAKYGMDVVQTEAGGERIALARHVGQMAVFQPTAAASAAHVPAASGRPTSPVDISMESATPVSASTPAAAPVAAAEPAGTKVTCPFVGTFYGSPSPDSAPFVTVGARVKKGQVLCIIEAMKIMNEIESELDGEVVAILADNAKPVEFGTPLFIIKT